MNRVSYSSRTGLKGIQLFRSRGGILQAELEGEHYARVKLVRSFPYTMPDRFISVRSADGREIAMIQDVMALAEASLRVVQEELHRNYMIPRVKQILSVKKRGAAWHLQIDTDYGAAALILDNLHENIQPVADSRWMVTDNDGRRFEMHDPDRMDARSREHWKKMS